MARYTFRFKTKNNATFNLYIYDNEIGTFETIDLVKPDLKLKVTAEGDSLYSRIFIPTLEVTLYSNEQDKYIDFSTHKSNINDNHHAFLHYDNQVWDPQTSRYITLNLLMFYGVIIPFEYTQNAKPPYITKFIIKNTMGFLSRFNEFFSSGRKKKFQETLTYSIFSDFITNSTYFYENTLNVHDFLSIYNPITQTYGSVLLNSYMSNTYLFENAQSPFYKDLKTIYRPILEYFNMRLFPASSCLSLGTDSEGRTIATSFVNYTNTIITKSIGYKNAQNDTTRAKTYNLYEDFNVIKIKKINRSDLNTLTFEANSTLSLIIPEGDFPDTYMLTNDQVSTWKLTTINQGVQASIVTNPFSYLNEVNLLKYQYTGNVLTPNQRIIENNGFSGNYIFNNITQNSEFIIKTRITLEYTQVQPQRPTQTQEEIYWTLSYHRPTQPVLYYKGEDAENYDFWTEVYTSIKIADINLFRANDIKTLTDVNLKVILAYNPENNFPRESGYIKLNINIPPARSFNNEIYAVFVAPIFVEPIQIFTRTEQPEQETRYNNTIESSRPKTLTKVFQKNEPSIENPNIIFDIRERTINSTINDYPLRYNAEFLRPFSLNTNPIKRLISYNPQYRRIVQGVDPYPNPQKAEQITAQQIFNDHKDNLIIYDLEIQKKDNRVPLLFHDFINMNEDAQTIGQKDLLQIDRYEYILATDTYIIRGHLFFNQNLADFNNYDVPILFRASQEA